MSEKRRFYNELLKKLALTVYYNKHFHCTYYRNIV